MLPALWPLASDPLLQVSKTRRSGAGGRDRPERAHAPVRDRPAPPLRIIDGPGTPDAAADRIVSSARAARCPSSTATGTSSLTTSWVPAACLAALLAIPVAGTAQTATQSHRPSVRPRAGAARRPAPAAAATSRRTGRRPRAEYDYDRREVMIPMRDGVKLHTVIVVPHGAHGLPMLLERTPYDATFFVKKEMPAPARRRLVGRPRMGRRRLHPRVPGRARQVRLGRRLHHDPPADRLLQPVQHRRHHATPGTPPTGCRRTCRSPTAASARSAPPTTAGPSPWPCSARIRR